MRNHSRFHTLAAARIVCDTAKRMTDISLAVDHIPHNDTRQDPPGEWAVVANSDIPFHKSGMFGSLIDSATQRALAEALRKHDPNHPLLSIWHLKPENYDKGYRHRFYSDGL